MNIQIKVFVDNLPFTVTDVFFSSAAFTRFRHGTLGKNGLITL
jgi:hypothetical protein